MAKAQSFDAYLDQSGFYASRVAPGFRSRMNVPFVLADESLNEQFLAQSREAGLMQLKGHKSVGGMRASIYKAMPMEGVQDLVSFMREFERRYGYHFAGQVVAAARRAEEASVGKECVGTERTRG